MHDDDVVAWLAQQTQGFSEKGVTELAVRVFSQFDAEMRRQNLTQTELASRAGLHRAHLSRLINDPGNVKLGTLVRIANALGLKLEMTAQGAAERPCAQADDPPPDALMEWDDAREPVRASLAA